MIPGALPAVLRYSVEVTSKGTDGRPMTDVREVDGWLELRGPLSHAFSDPPPKDLAEPDPSEPQVARFWHCGAVVPKPGDLITVHTDNGQPLAHYDVLMTCADHLVVGLHELPAHVPNHEEVHRA